MAGLVAAARLRELGHEPRVLEKGTRAGGSMLLSSCVAWRHVEWERFRAECPRGDEQLQRLIWERLDDGLAWLESHGAEPVWSDTENPLTTGRRYDPRALTRLLVGAAGEIELETPLPVDAEPPVLLATGGFPGRLARERDLLLRANPWSEGDGLDYAVARGAETTAGMEEFYGREARVFTDDWSEITPLEVAWHENDLVQLIGRRAWYCVAETNGRIEALRAAGGTVIEQEYGLAVHVAAAVTHTIGGLLVDTEARVTGTQGLWAAGVDAGGVATGGYSSGLAQALVLGLVAAESIAG
jgi:hypothetical protein